jgi:hypothetical protein
VCEVYSGRQQVSSIQKLRVDEITDSKAKFRLTGPGDNMTNHREQEGDKYSLPTLVITYMWRKLFALILIS